MTKQNKSILIWGLFGLVVLTSLYLIVTIGFWVVSQNRAYPGVTVAGIDVSGKNEVQIEAALAPQIQEYQKNNLNFETASPAVVPAVNFKLTPDYAKTAGAALAWGAGNPFLLGQKHDFPIVFTADQDALSSQLITIESQVAMLAENPSYFLSDGQVKAKAGSVGHRVNLAETAANFYDSASHLRIVVPVSEFDITPSAELTPESSELAEIQTATKNPLTITAPGTTVTADQNTLVSWVDPSGEQPTLAQQFGDDPFLAVISSGSATESLFSTQAVSNYLTNLSGQINKTAVNAQLAAQNGQVIAAVPAQNGQTLNVAASTTAVLGALSSGSSSVNLTVDLQKPAVSGDNLAELGLKELVSTGTTNFAGSPANRLVNIQVGTARFNGILISPNEVFSFNDTLGPVDAEHGYLPELVILQNKTTPEYGGGMCQVSSTAFRAALNAGMPILARTAHAYPVSYYKPYGVDATIYLPEPDLIFKNDTGHYILIQTHIDGTRLSFDFYGTKPARTITFAGSADAAGAVFPVEQVSPSITEPGARGTGSFTAQFWRFIYDTSGKLVTKSTWISKYDSPSNYPH